MFDSHFFLELNEDDQHKEIYANFGLCIFHFQMLEHQLINMILAHHVSQKPRPDKSGYEDIFYRNSKKTMGQLIKTTIKLYKFSDPIREELWSIHEERNYYAHHYFKDKVSRWDTEVGRVAMLQEIDSIDHRTIELDRVLTSTLLENLKTLEITQTTINQYTDKMKTGEVVDDLPFRKTTNLDK